MKKLLEEFKNSLFKELEVKPSWGKEQVKELFILTLNEVLLEKYEKSD